MRAEKETFPRSVEDLPDPSPTEIFEYRIVPREQLKRPKRIEGVQLLPDEVIGRGNVRLGSDTTKSWFEPTSEIIERFETAKRLPPQAGHVVSMLQCQVAVAEPVETTE